MCLLRKFLADNGGEFGNDKYRDMCENLNIEVRNNAALVQLLSFNCLQSTLDKAIFRWYEIQNLPDYLFYMWVIFIRWY